MNLETELRLVEAQLKPSRFDEASSDFGSADYDGIKSDFENKLTNALDSFQNGNGDTRHLEARMQKAIRDAYPAAYKDGAARWGRTTLTESDQAWINKAITSETKFVRNFANDLSGKSDAYIANRASLYVDGLDSIRTSGWVEASPDGTVFIWNLGNARHCSDCPLLADNSPYTKEDLPTVPGADTQCGSRCACSLDIQSAPSSMTMTKTTLSLDDLYGSTNTGRTPNLNEQIQLDELRSQNNYWSRTAMDATTNESIAIANTNKDASVSALVNMIHEKSLRNVPMLSMGAVITTRDVKPDVVEQILERGIDGQTLSLIPTKDFNASMKQLTNEYKSYLNTAS